MLREELIRAVSKIKEDLESSNILPIIAEMLSKSPSSEPKEPNDSRAVLSFEIINKYLFLIESYGDLERRIFSILEIPYALEIDFWKHAYEARNDPAVIRNYFERLYSAVEPLPQIVALLDQKSILQVKDDSDEIPEVIKGKSLLSILVIEEENRYSNPRRFIDALESITGLYSVCSLLEDENENELIVFACDSGSDKSFDFLGIAKIVEQVKEIIINIWDRRVYTRHIQISESLDHITETLPILEKIDDLYQKGVISREQAEILKRNTIEAVELFFRAGITIPELEVQGVHSPRQLLKPEPKFLASPEKKPKTTRVKRRSTSRKKK